MHRLIPTNQDLRQVTVTFVAVHSAPVARPRVATLWGRPFRVIPAVLVRSQVLHNNLGLTYLPADEITDEWAEMWNGIPVLIGEHPSADGVHVSGRTPELWEARGVGWIFNARAEADGADARRLVAEVWMDEARAAAVPGFQDVLDRLSAGHAVELSTGFATQVEERSGEFNGEPFNLVMHPLGADHLVVSAAMIGACAIHDGCGLGANHKEEAVLEKEVAANCAPGAEPAVGSVATANVLEGKTTGVHVQADTRGPVKRLLDRIGVLLEAPPRPERVALEENTARSVKRELEALNQVSPSDQERAQMLVAALQQQLGGQDKHVVLTDVFTSDKTVVFWFDTPLGAQPKGAEFYSAQFTEDAEGRLTFSDPVRVRRMTTYSPVAANAEEAAANRTTEEEVAMEKDGKDEKTAAVAAGNQDMTELFAAMEARLLTKLEEVLNAREPKAIAGLKQSVAALAADVGKLSGVTKQAVEERERERQTLVASLAGNYKVPFTEGDLEGKPIEELRKLAQMAQTENYEARGGPRGAGGEEQKFAPTVPYFAKPEAGKDK